MFNNKGESKMEKTILVVEVITYSSGKKYYNIKKHAETLDKATEYIVALKNLNEDKDITYKLFNEFGQFEVEEIQKVKEVADEITL
tara:strand:- start:5 stop:262 length:258 start_codon:yes stop_codon:yes gene_type:complete